MLQWYNLSIEKLIGVCMNGSKFYSKDIDIVRLFACIFVFLYHVGLLKGGFFAVCIFCL